MELKFKYFPSWKEIEIKSNNPMKMKWPSYLIQKLSVKKKKKGGGGGYIQRVPLSAFAFL